MSTLDEFLDDVLAPDAEVDGPWEIDSLGSADWAGRKVQTARWRLAELQAERDRQVAMIDDWLARESKQLVDTAQFFEGKLGDWLRREIDADDSKKPKVSRNLPCGLTVKRTGGSPSLVVDDEDQLVTWLKDHGAEDLTEYVPKWNVDKSGVKKRFRMDDDRLCVVDETSGEIVDVAGAHIQRGAFQYRAV